MARSAAFQLEAAVRGMTHRVRHRGPDDEGFYVRGRVALGHRRLSIIDLSASGRQPMESADGRYVITYNGEIYNYLELRAELEGKGVHFRTRTDTEVLLAAYAAWGSDCLSRLNGMWAFAIYDRERDAIFAARDRFGVKPFYHVSTSGCFAFGSEIRQLLPLLPSIAADPAAVSEFLFTGVNVASENTFFAGVAKLAPGHCLLYEVATDKLQLRPWYSLEDRVAQLEQGFAPASDADVVDGFRELFEQSVSLRLRSDVRVGSCLSGGLDSGSIAITASLLQRREARRFSAVTAVSQDPRNSEESYAGKVVRAGALDWVRTCPGYDEFRALLPTVVEHQEEPFGTPSACMQAFVMRAAKESGIVVLLDGQGGDEVLLGYGKYYPAYCVVLWREGGARKLLEGIACSMRSNVDMRPSRLAAYCLFGLAPKLRHLYYAMRASYLTEKPALPEWAAAFSAASFDVRRLQMLEIGSTSLPALLRYEDKNSMAWSIETRLPFLDYRLVERSIALAPHFKMRDGWTKWVLRRAMTGTLPDDIAWRRNKIAFEAPSEVWIPRHLGVMAAAVGRSPLLARFCNLERLARCYPTLDRNRQWRLYSLALWEEAFGVRA